MLILAIETATDVVGVAVADARRVRAEAHVATGRRHGETLAALVASTCERAGVAQRELDAIAVDVGPGLYTGMRVGIAHAKAAAWALGIPVIGVRSTDVLARSADAGDRLVLAALDDRRHELVWALHRRTGLAGDRLVEVAAPRVGTVEECVADLLERGLDVAVVGDATVAHREAFARLLDRAPFDVRHPGEGATHPSAATLATIARERALDEDWTTPAELTAAYLRAPDAEIRWATR
ncbi:MAG: tRNA (adenosine(37)-N6)-threonylcarbamoyltransferase complex dimerization subunit type 1 TsaB [Ilumatobacteraceae bacterium]